MRFFYTLSLSAALVVAHNDGFGIRDHHGALRRQAPSPSPAAPPASSSSPAPASVPSTPVPPGSPGTPAPGGSTVPAGASSPAPASPASGSGSIPAATGTISGNVTLTTVNGTAMPITATGAPATTPLPTVPITLTSSNPTAVPLSLISANMSSSATVDLPTTFAAGAVPTGIPGAPPLPDISSLSPSSYPPPDKSPPLDSPEVQQWIQDVQNSGVTIPDFTPTTGFASCQANPQAVADTTRCWWTCTGCTRPSDITTCPDQGTWGMTYDDGPGFYTPNLLDYLDQVNLKTTFFTIGSRVLQFPHTLQTEFMTGHQLGVHTWSHPPLTTQTNEQIIAELGWTKKIIKDVTGLTPNTMRPPYGDIDDRVRAISLAMGLTPVIWTRLSPAATFDTGDFNIAGGLISVTEVLSNWDNIVGNSSEINTGFIVLEHDLFEQTVDLATGYIIPDALAHQPSFNIMPVISCLNKPLSDAYIETNNNSTNPPPAGVSSAAVTLSSGAPGSAQATGSAQKGGAPSSYAFSPYLATFFITGATLGAALLHL